MPNIEEYKTKHYLYIGDVFNNCKKYCAERFSFAKNYILIVRIKTRKCEDNYGCGNKKNISVLLHNGL